MKVFFIKSLAFFKESEAKKFIRFCERTLEDNIEDISEEEILQCYEAFLDNN